MGGGRLVGNIKTGEGSEEAFSSIYPCPKRIGI
jgi:hypothetical protein